MTAEDRTRYDLTNLIISMLPKSDPRTERLIRHRCLKRELYELQVVAEYLKAKQTP